MTKNIIIGILLLFCGFLFVMGYVQKEEAIRQNNIVQSNMELAKEQEAQLKGIISQYQTQNDSLLQMLNECNSTQ